MGGGRICKGEIKYGENLNEKGCNRKGKMKIGIKIIKYSKC
jgi:hypothetical protein